jgi:hypothetical protein
MLGVDAQQRAREALRRVDQLLAAELETENQVRRQSESFRDSLFSAFQFVESETMALQELQVQIKRLDKQQLQVQSKGRLPFVLLLDSDIAYDWKPVQTEGATQSVYELGSRLFAAMLSPQRGVLRYYTIFGDGAWKRTTFALGAQGVQERNALVPRFNAEVLIREAIDLLGYVCLLHPTWATLADESETITIEVLRERHRLKSHPTGLGAPRRQPTGQE